MSDNAFFVTAVLSSEVLERARDKLVEALKTIEPDEAKLAVAHVLGMIDAVISRLRGDGP